LPASNLTSTQNKKSNNNEIKKVTHLGLSIKGNEAFVLHITNALNLVSEKAPEEFAMLKKYVMRIEQYEKSGMRVESKTIELADPTTFHSLEWCASVLVHEAFHSKFYHDYMKNNPGQAIPYDVYAGTEIEKKCNVLQAEVGEKIGLSQDDIEYLRKADGKHGDTDGDGDIDDDDYKLRDWE
jgi:hypothetical protein